MTLVKYIPRKEKSLIPSLFDWERDPFDMFREMERWFPERLPPSGKWAPVVDVFERNGSLVIKAELPGIAIKDIDVSVTGDTLLLRGELSEETETEGKGFYRHERFHGVFERLIPLPTDVDPEKVNATYEKGILEVVLPITEITGTHTVEVKVK